MMEEPGLQLPQVLSPCSSGRRRSSDSSSPEFEFWMVRNPSFPQPNLLSADELFLDGVLLPLRVLQLHSSDKPPEVNPAPASAAETEPEPSGSDRNNDNEPGSTPEVSSVLSALLAPAPTSSKRWKDIFKKSDRRNSRDGIDDGHSVKEKDKDKRKEKKSSGVGAGSGGNNAVSAAELNINIWPFSRSRSAGNGGSRPRMAAGATRKVSSAPCSRSNSAGESKSRKWPSSPSRGGVHLGRSSPVWQVRRGGGSTGKSVDLAVKNAEKPVKKEGNEPRRKTTGAVSAGGGGTKAKVLHLNVPMCIGYRHHLSCRSDENNSVSVVTAAAAGGSGDSTAAQGSGSSSDEVIRGSNLFNLRNLFTKKVH